MSTTKSPSPTSPTTIQIIHCWSAPRSRSTALLYSFESRPDCIAIDEPLYRSWLKFHSAPPPSSSQSSSSSVAVVTRPYTNELLSGMPHCDSREQDAYKWKRELMSLEERIEDAVGQLMARGTNEGEGEGEGEDVGFVFLKHMAKHAPMYDFRNESNRLPQTSPFHTSVILSHRHVLLLRDPIDVVSSWSKSNTVHQSVSIHEVGILPLLSVYADVTSYQNHHNRCTVLDSNDLVTDPQTALVRLCRCLDAPFRTEMMQWKDGPHECDGPWADWWYHNVHKTTGWGVGVDVGAGASGTGGDYRTISPELLPALRASQPAYEYLLRLTYGYRHRAITTDTTTDGTNNHIDDDDKDDGVSSSSWSLYEDLRNKDLLVWVGAKGRGRLVTRENAGVSPWDSSVQGGDAVWEGLRVYNGRILSFNAHLTRLYKSAKSLHYSNIPPRSEITHAVFRTLAANNMRDGAHLRLTLTRGEKYTSSMNPDFNVYGTTLIVLAEWKPTVGGRTTYDNSRGIRLVTCAGRRNSPSTCDSKVHHCNMINNILPKIQANQAGCADALMLDLNGFVSETNATNVFMVDEHGVLVTPTADHCLPGITRATVLFLAGELGIKTEVRNVSLAEFYAAEECFTTGTMGELTPVTEIDGRVIGGGWGDEGNEGGAGGAGNAAGKVTSRLQGAYRKLPEKEGWSTEIPPFDN